MITLSDFFFELWRTASSWTHIDRAQAFTGDTAEREFFNKTLLSDDEQKIVKILKGHILSSPSSNTSEISQVLTCMLCIDAMFARIHPRFLSQSSGIQVEKNSWLKKYQRNRLDTGYFAKNERNYLLARGPLLRSNRDENASSAESLADRFHALSVTNCRFENETKYLNIEISIVSTEAIHGVPLGNRAGKERIACIAIAEDSDDICTTSRHCGDSGFIRYELASHVNSAERMFNAMRLAGKLDIAVAPELVMSTSDVNNLEGLLSVSSTDCRIIIAGSGNAPAEVGEPPWNESRILNASGFSLWKQRKVWPASISAQHAEQMQFCINPESDVYYEDNSDDATLKIVDVDGLGRCLVLICQDLKDPFICDVMRQYQPDWVFVPILDVGIDPGRWHQRTIFPLSEISQTRFLVSSCMSLALRQDPSAKPNLGMLHGPFAADGVEINRCIAFVKSQATVSPHFVAFGWDGLTWMQSCLVADSPI